MPEMTAPMQKTRKLPIDKPQAPIAAPVAPPAAPKKKPARRPNRCMSMESGVAVSIEPMTIMVIGRVAQQTFGARLDPASPAMVKIIGSCAPRTAWAATRTRTLRRAEESEVLFGGAAGGGKTYAQVADMVLFAMRYPGSKQLMLRRTLPEMDRSVVPMAIGLYPAADFRYHVSSHTGVFGNRCCLKATFDAH